MAHACFSARLKSLRSNQKLLALAFSLVIFFSPCFPVYCDSSIASNQLTFRSGGRWRCSLTCSCLISLPISTCDGANSAADVVIDVVLQVCEGYAHRPIGSSKAATIEQDNPVILGKPKHDVERMHIFLHPLDDVFAEVLASKKLEINQPIVVVEVLVWTDFD